MRLPYTLDVATKVCVQKLGIATTLVVPLVLVLYASLNEHFSIAQPLVRRQGHHICCLCAYIFVYTAGMYVYSIQIGKDGFVVLLIYLL